MSKTINQIEAMAAIVHDFEDFIQTEEYDNSPNIMLSFMQYLKNRYNL